MSASAVTRSLGAVALPQSGEYVPVIAFCVAASSLTCAEAGTLATTLRTTAAIGYRRLVIWSLEGVVEAGMAEPAGSTLSHGTKV